MLRSSALVSLSAGLVAAACSSAHTADPAPPAPDAGRPEVDAGVVACSPPERAVVAADGDPGWHPVLVVGAEGAPHVVHQNRDTGRLELARFDGGAWTNRELPEVGEVSAFAAVAVGEELHVVCVSGDRLVRVRVGAGGDVVEPLPLGVARTSRVSLAVGDGGALHVAYSDLDESGAGFGMPTGGIRLATERAGAWTDRSVAEVAGPFDLATTGTVAAVAYVTREGVRLARYDADGARLSDAVVDPRLAREVRVAADPAGELEVLAVLEEEIAISAASGDELAALEVPGGAHDVAWLARADRHVLHVTRGGELRWATGTGGWEARAVFPGRQTRGRPAVALGDDGAIHAAFYDWNDGALVVDVLDAELPPCGAAPPALTELGRWRTEPITGAPDWPVAVRTAASDLAVDDSGALHVVYAFGASACCDALRYATNETGAWRTERLADYTEGFDVAVDDHGGVHVVHVAPDGARHHFRRDGTTWTREDVAAMPPADAASYARAASGRPLEVVYSALRELHHARFDGGAWTVEVVDPGIVDHLFMDVSAVVDDSGFFHTSYFDHYGELRYATNAGGGWTHHAVDAAYGRGAIGHQDGVVDVVYGRGTTLMHGRRTGGEWTLARLDTSDRLFRDVSVARAGAITFAVTEGGYYGANIHAYVIGAAGAHHRELAATSGTSARAVLDAAGRPHVVYYDREARSLRHATRE